MLKGLYEKGRKMDWRVPEPDSQSSPKRKARTPPVSPPRCPRFPPSPALSRQMGLCSPRCWRCDPRGRRTRLELEPAAGTGLPPPLPNPSRGPVLRDSLPAGTGSHRSPHPAYPNPPAGPGALIKHLDTARRLLLSSAAAGKGQAPGTGHRGHGTGDTAGRTRAPSGACSGDAVPGAG